MSSIKKTITITANPIIVQEPTTTPVTVDVTGKEYDIIVTGYGRLSDTRIGGSFDNIIYKNILDYILPVEFFDSVSGREYSDSAAVNEQFLVLFGKEFQDFLPISEILSFNIQKPLEETLILSENISLTVDISKTETLLTSEKLTFFSNPVIDEQVISQEVLFLNTTKTLEDSFSLEESVEFLSNFYRNFSENVSAADLLSYSLTKNIFENVLLVEDIDLQKFIETADDLVDNTSVSEDLHFAFETSLEDSLSIANDIIYFDVESYKDETFGVSENLLVETHDYSLEDYFETKFDYVNSQII